MGRIDDNAEDHPDHAVGFMTSLLLFLIVGTVLHAWAGTVMEPQDDVKPQSAQAVSHHERHYLVTNGNRVHLERTSVTF